MNTLYYTILIKLIIFSIIHELEQLCSGYKDEVFRIVSFFFAVDGMLLGDTVVEAEQVIARMGNSGKEHGLEITKQKNRIIIFYMKDKPPSIGNISNFRIWDKFKYLGSDNERQVELFSGSERRDVQKGN